MLHVKWKYTRLTALLCGLFTVIILMAGMVCAGYAEKGTEDRGVRITARQERKTVWSIRLSHDLYDLSEGKIMALLLNLEVPEGWLFDKVDTGEGAAGLTLTVGDTGQRVISVLLDGTVYEDAGRNGSTPILWIYVKTDPETTAEQGGFVGIKGGSYGELAIYRMEESGKIEKIALYAESIVPEETTKEVEETDGWTETVTDSEEEETTVLGGEEEWVGPEEETMGYPQSRFLGCQETEMRNGYYSVRFLFCGEEEKTPVICLRGGGVLYMETHALSDVCDWETVCGEDHGYRISFCIFRGLRAEETYDFVVFTEGKTVTVRYSQGRFMGFYTS